MIRPSCVCVCVCVCVSVCLSVCLSHKLIDFVFAVRVITENSYFVGGSDFPAERETSHGGGLLDLDNFRLSLRHGRPSQHQQLTESVTYQQVFGHSVQCNCDKYA